MGWLNLSSEGENIFPSSIDARDDAGESAT
jgi:hypothetical protein